MTSITAAQVEAAARIIAHRMDFAEGKWREYEDVTRTALEAAAAAGDHGPDLPTDEWEIHPGDDSLETNMATGETRKRDGVYGEDEDFEQIEVVAAEYASKGYEPMDSEPGEWLIMRNAKTGHGVTITPDGVGDTPESGADPMPDTITPHKPTGEGCEKCGRLVELFHNEATGMALCEECDMAADDDKPEILRDAIGSGTGVHLFRNRGIVSVVLVDDENGIPLPGTPSAEINLQDLIAAVAALA